MAIKNGARPGTSHPQASPKGGPPIRTGAKPGTGAPAANRPGNMKTGARPGTSGPSAGRGGGSGVKASAGAPSATGRKTANSRGGPLVKAKVAQKGSGPVARRPAPEPDADDAPPRADYRRNAPGVLAGR